MRAEIMESEVALRNPIRGIFVGCCASAEKQSAKSMAPTRLRAKRMALGVKTIRFLLMRLLQCLYRFQLFALYALLSAYCHFSWRLPSTAMGMPQKEAYEHHNLG
jgi:hypothetical protein